MVARLRGRTAWDCQKDNEGHREYLIEWLVQTSTTDGPAVAMNCPGLPTIGSPWAFGTDFDGWAFCHPGWRIQMGHAKGEPGRLWLVTQPFSTRPLRRCQDSTIENPLAEPPRLSGSFVKFMREASQDRFGKAIRTPSHERIRGSLVEFDANNPTVRISMNTLTLPLEIISPMVDAVNDAPMWGLGARMIKLSNVSWERLLYGTCNFYYTLDLEFDIDYRTFDRNIAAEGTRCLIGWMPGSTQAQIDPDGIDPDTGEANYKNPRNFEVYKDINGENGRCFLDEKGRPVFDEDDIYSIKVEKYPQTNLLELGIPSSF